VHWLDQHMFDLYPDAAIFHIATPVWCIPEVVACLIRKIPDLSDPQRWRENRPDWVAAVESRNGPIATADDIRAALINEMKGFNDRMSVLEETHRMHRIDFTDILDPSGCRTIVERLIGRPLLDADGFSRHHGAWLESNGRLAEDVREARARQHGLDV